MKNDLPAMLPHPDHSMIGINTPWQTIFNPRKSHEQQRRTHPLGEVVVVRGLFPPGLALMCCSAALPLVITVATHEFILRCLPLM
jgi:hypothetical protein